MLYVEVMPQSAPLNLRAMAKTAEDRQRDREATAARLREAVEHSGMDLTAARKVLALALGVSGAAVGQALNAVTEMSAPNCAKAARALGVSCYWLATGEGSMLDKLSPEAQRVAEQIDALRKDPDPDRLKWALQVAGLVFTRRPRTAAEMGALVASLSAEAPPTPAHPPHQ